MTATHPNQVVSTVALLVVYWLMKQQKDMEQVIIESDSLMVRTAIQILLIIEYWQINHHPWYHHHTQKSFKN